MPKKRRRKKIKLIPIIITLLVLGLIAGGIIYGPKLFKHDVNPEPAKPKKEEKKPPKVYNASLIMVGDALIHSSVYNDANRLANWNGYDFKPQMELIKEKVQGYDLAYYNQETILGGTSLGLSDYPTFNSPQEVGDAFIDAGFNLVSLATNHTADRGKQAILNSREYWNKQDGVWAVGSYSSAEEKKEIENLLEKELGKKVTLNIQWISKEEYFQRLMGK